MSGALANLKTTYERTKSKILAKGEHDSEDSEYFGEKERALTYEQVMLRLNKRTKKTMELFGEMCKLQNEIANDLTSMYPADDRMHTTVALVKEAYSNAELNRQKMNERMERNSIRPVDEYCASFRELKRRTDEYSIRRTDLDKHKVELQKLQEKGTVSAPKIPAAEEKVRVATLRFDEMREELMHDLPAINNDRNVMLGYVLACSLKSRAEYYTDLAEKFSVVNSMVSSIDERSVLSHGKVITPAERSAAATSLRAHPVFNKGDGPRPAQGTQAPPPQQQQTTKPAQQPLVQPSYSLQKQPEPTHNSIYQAEYGSITNPPAAPVSETSMPPPSSGYTPVKAVGLYDFTASEDNELTFKKGDIITIVAKQHGDWWEGELNGVAGLLPSNYVREV